MATLTSTELEELRANVAQLVGAAVVSTQSDIEAGLQALETWWTDGQATTPSSSAESAISSATTGTLASAELAALKAVWLAFRGAKDTAAL